MKLNEQLLDGNLLSHDFFNHRILRAFNVHLENVDPAMPLKLHGGRQPHDWKTHGFPPTLASLYDGVRNPVFAGRRKKGLFSIVCNDSRLLKMKLPRQGLGGEPLLDFGSGVERFHIYSKMLDKRQIEGNVLPDSQRVDNSAWTYH